MLLNNAFNFSDEPHNALVLLVSLSQGGLEVGMSVDESLDLLHGVHDEHVHQVLASSVQPVVEGSGALRELQVQDVDLLQDALGIVQRLATALSQGAQTVPLVADALTTRVYGDAVVVLKGAEKNKF